MAFYGHPTELYAAVLYMIFAVITGVLCLIQLVFLQKLNIWSVYWLPLLSFCMCYENVLLYLGDHISRHSSVAYAGNVFHALQIPIFVIVLYEVSYRLHEARSAQFLYYIRFDLGGSATELTALLSLWIVRTIAAGLFVMTLITDFFILPKNHRSKVTGAGGYYAFSRDDNEHSVSLWLNLIPPIVLTVAGITIGISLYRYGHNLTIGIHYTRRWRIILITAICQAVGQCFWAKVYPITSNAGEIVLLVGCSAMVWTVQEDLALAGTFADFLRSSNYAFKGTTSENASPQKATPPPLPPSTPLAPVPFTLPPQTPPLQLQLQLQLQPEPDLIPPASPHRSSVDLDSARSALELSSESKDSVKVSGKSVGSLVLANPDIETGGAAPKLTIARNTSIGFGFDEVYGRRRMGSSPKFQASNIAAATKK